jgi:hypothetical protein
VIARQGSSGPGPNLGSGINFSSSTFLNVRPLINATNTIAFQAGLTGTGITTNNNQGFWKSADRLNMVVARSGTQGPGPNLGPDVVFDAFGTLNLTASGAPVFSATLRGAGVDTTNRIGIWSTVSGSMQLLARTGTSGPGPNLGPGVYFSTISGVGSNDAGQIVFEGEVTGTGITTNNDNGIWSTRSGTLTAVGREGVDGPAPGPGFGPGVVFNGFTSSVANNASGATAFLGILRGAGVNSTNDRGIWSDASGTLTPIARAGPTGPGPNISEGIYFSFVDKPTINGRGDVAFLGGLTGPGINSTNNFGIWTTVDGTLQNVVRTGQLFDVDPGLGFDWRTISNIANSQGLFASGGQDGEPRWLNDDGTVAFRLNFTDGSSGIFTATALPSSGPVSLTPTLDARATWNGSAFSVTDGDSTILTQDIDAINLDRRGVMEFSLRRIPDAARITGATLTLDVTTFTSSPPSFPILTLLGYAGNGQLDTADATAGTQTIGVSDPVTSLGLITIELDTAFIQSLIGEEDYLGLLALGDPDGRQIAWAALRNNVRDQAHSDDRLHALAAGRLEPRRLAE